LSVGFVICHRSLIIRHFQKIADLAETLHPPETAIQTVTLQRQDVLFHHGDTGREKKFKIHGFHARKLLKILGVFLHFPIFSHDHRGHGDFTEASGFSVHLRVLGVSVVNKVLEPFLSLASHNSSAFPGLSTFNSFYSFSLSLTPRDGHTSLAQRMKLSEIARKLGCELKSDGDVEIRRVAGIDEAGPGDLTFVSNRKYIRRIKSTRASAIILGNDVPEAPLPSLRTDDPYLAFAKAIELFYQPPRLEPGIHPSAVIAHDARVGPGASIGPYVVIGIGCVIGANATLHAHATLYPFVTLGDDVVLHTHAIVRECCRLGNRVIIQNGAVIGSDGFGFVPMRDGSYYKITQSGRVLVEDDVEIGANTTIDRAAVGDTVIRRGAKLDNLVQIGHGSEVGENAVLAAQVGLAGSSHLGPNVKVGGQAGIAGHLKVGDGAVITAQSGTSHDIEPGAVVSGSPVMNTAVWRRAVVALASLPDLLKRVREMEKELDRLKRGAPAPHENNSLL